MAHCWGITLQWTGLLIVLDHSIQKLRHSQRVSHTEVSTESRIQNHSDIQRDPESIDQIVQSGPLCVRDIVLIHSRFYPHSMIYCHKNQGTSMELTPDNFTTLGVAYLINSCQNAETKVFLCITVTDKPKVNESALLI